MKWWVNGAESYKKVVPDGKKAAFVLTVMSWFDEKEKKLLQS